MEAATARPHDIRGRWYASRRDVDAEDLLIRLQVWRTVGAGRDSVPY